MEYSVYKRGKNKGRPKTETDRIKRFLVEGLNCSPVVTRSRYKAYILPAIYQDSDRKKDQMLFVGQASVRRGTCRSKSFSCTNEIYSYMERWEADQNL